VQQLATGGGATFAAVDGAAGGHGEHDKIVIQRTSPADTARANGVLQAAIQMFGNLGWNQAIAPAGKPDADHRIIPDSMKAQWKAQYPGLPVPNRVVFDRATQRPVGLLFVGGGKAPDLGMGQVHQHKAGGPIMQHLWFTPGNLDLAFGDAMVKHQAIPAALAR
jgi:hypothetical protein